MAYILQLETASTNCSVSLSKEGKLMASKEFNSATYSHSEQLHLFIEEVLAEAKIDLKQLDALAVSKGPGSYTGLRIGVSAAKGLCYTLDIPLISLNTLKSMAIQIEISEGVIVPMLDARRMEVYASVFNHKYQEVAPTKAIIINADSFMEYAQKGKVYLIGSGALKCKEVLRHPNYHFDETVVPSSRSMSMEAYTKYRQNQFEDVAYFEPYYLKDFILQQKK